MAPSPVAASSSGASGANNGSVTPIADAAESSQATTSAPSPASAPLMLEAYQAVRMLDWSTIHSSAWTAMQILTNGNDQPYRPLLCIGWSGDE